MPGGGSVHSYTMEEISAEEGLHIKPLEKSPPDVQGCAEFNWVSAAIRIPWAP